MKKTEVVDITKLQRQLKSKYRILKKSVEEYEIKIKKCEENQSLINLVELELAKADILDIKTDILVLENQIKNLPQNEPSNE